MSGPAAGIGALLLGDARFPAGGHAHSGGVEPAVTAGTVTGLGTLEAFLRGRLRTAGLVAAAIAAAACAHARLGPQITDFRGTGSVPENPEGADSGASTAHGSGPGRAAGVARDAGSGPAGEPGNRARGGSAAPVPDEYWALLDAEADARTPAPAQREASRRQGRALLRAARAAWPDAAALADLAATGGLRGAGAGRTGGNGTAGRGGGAATAEARGAHTGGPAHAGGPADAAETTRLPAGAGTRDPRAGGTASGDGGTADRDGAPRAEYRGGPHHAVVLGAAAAAAGCGPPEAARIAAYQAVAGPASAAVRLLALDPMRVAGLLAGLAADIDQVAAQGAGYAAGPPGDLPATSGPALDLLAETHIRAEARLFES